MTKRQRITISAIAALAVIGGGVGTLTAINYSNAKTLSENLAVKTAELQQQVGDAYQIKIISNDYSVFGNKAQFQMNPDFSKDTDALGALITVQSETNLLSPLTGKANVQLVGDLIGPGVEKYNIKAPSPWMIMNFNKIQDNHVQADVNIKPATASKDNLTIELGEIKGTVVYGNNNNVSLTYSVPQASITDKDNKHTIVATGISGTYDYNIIEQLKSNQPFSPISFTKSLKINTIEDKGTENKIQGFDANIQTTFKDNAYNTTQKFSVANVTTPQFNNVSGTLAFHNSIPISKETQQIYKNFVFTSGNTPSKEAKKEFVFNLIKSLIPQGPTLAVDQLSIKTPNGNINLQGKISTTPAQNFTLYQNTNIELSAEATGLLAKAGPKFVNPILGLPAPTEETNAQDYKASLLYSNGQVKVNGTDTNPALTALFSDKLKALDLGFGFTKPVVDETSNTYVSRLTTKVKASVVDGLDKKGLLEKLEKAGDNPVVVIRIKQSPNGTVENATVIKSSGIKEFDDAVLEGVKNASPLPTNTDKPVDSTIDITYVFKDLPQKTK